jgi:hypothetical protein
VALTAAQIVDLSCQIAKCDGFTLQAINLLNQILLELSQDYDFDIIRKSFTFTFSTTANGLGYAPGSGPNPMPSDFLRLHRKGHFYDISGVKMRPTGVDQAEFDSYVQQAGLNSYPTRFYVNVAETPMGLYVWPPASGAFAATVRYNPVMPDLPVPADATVPWFPNPNYLITRLSGELMRITNDDRLVEFLSDDEDRHPAGAGVILKRYMRMKDNPEQAAKMVMLDPRLFRGGWGELRNTKLVGW